MKRVKVKIIDPGCVAHIADSTCCNYDMKNTIFDAIISSNSRTRYPVRVIGERFADGQCLFPKHQVEILDDGEEDGE